jgi:DNA-binding MarR family transcriptional regulator
MAVMTAEKMLVGHLDGYASGGLIIKNIPAQKGFMEIFKDYAFVVSGKKRAEVLKLLAFPRTPSELAKMLQVHPNVITRILKDLSARNLVEAHELTGRKNLFRLTSKGELSRKVLENLSEPKNISELAQVLKTHHSVLKHLLKEMVTHGLIGLFKSLKPARKFYQLTSKGEEVREKIEVP